MKNTFYKDYNLHKSLQLSFPYRLRPFVFIDDKTEQALGSAQPSTGRPLLLNKPLFFVFNHNFLRPHFSDIY